MAKTKTSHPSAFCPASMQEQEIDRLRDLAAFFEMMEDLTNYASMGMTTRHGPVSMTGQAVMFQYISRLLGSIIYGLVQVSEHVPAGKHNA